MRMKSAGENRLVALGDAMRHQHRFTGASRAVIHRSIGNIHARQRGNLCLEFKQILQRALRDFRLIGRVARQKFRALNQMINSCGHMMFIGACTHKKWSA